MTLKAWRYWWMHPETTGGALKLISPYSGSGHARADDRWPIWESQRYRAHCPIDPNHEPPAQDCGCGVYASANLLDLLYQAKLVPRVYRPRSTLHVAMGRVEITNPVVQRDPHHRDVQDIRGSEAVIERLWICDGATHMVAEMQDRYGVPVTPSEPRFTAADWDAKTPSRSFHWAEVGLFPGDALNDEDVAAR